MTKGVGGKVSLSRQISLLNEGERLGRTGSFEWFPETGEANWSDNGYRLLGYEPGERDSSLGRFLASVHPDDRERMTNEAEQLARGGFSRLFDYRVVLPNGEVRHLRSIIGIVEGVRGQPTRVAGVMQDVTDLLRAQREVAAHAAVATALTQWEGFDDSAGLLLQGLAEALGCAGASFSVQSGEAMVLRHLWHESNVDLSEFESAGERLPLGRGVGLEGRVWAAAEPIRIADLSRDRTFLRRRLALDAGLRSAIAFPVLNGEEVLAVISLYATQDPEPSASLMRSLWGIGHEIGRFLAERRGEFMPSILTARELEVLRLAGQGYSGPQIAESLVLSPSTIKTHFAHIYEKLGVSDRASAVAKGLREGLIE